MFKDGRGLETRLGVCGTNIGGTTLGGTNI
jgi:hypothetical protein